MIGKTISHYKIFAKLGEGGMGVVYKALDVKLDRFVALKFLPPSFRLDEDSKKHFIREAKAASSIDHVNVCTIYEVGETDDKQLFIAMAYYDGQTLRKKIKNKALKQNETVAIALQIARGLFSAHNRGIIHRDIKPENILITNEGVVKILDFGLAKFIFRSTDTHHDSTGGTAAYMSPEQVRGEKIDLRSDIWSFGVVLYEMISGRIPFIAEYEQAIIYNILNEKPKRIDTTYGEKAKALNSLVMKCLEKDKEKRPSSFKEIIDQLANSIPSKPLFLILKKIKYSRILLFLSLIILLSVSAFWLYSHYETKEQMIPKQNWRLAVLPFIDNTNSADSLDFSLTIQSLIVQQLTGIAELAIIDPLSLNSYIENSLKETNLREYKKLYDALGDLSISFLIDGTITFSAKKYLIQFSLIDPKSLSILFSKTITFNTCDEVPDAVNRLVNELLDYFQVRRLLTDKDLMPWIKPGSQNMAAIKAFLQASKYNFLGEKTIAERYFVKALRLDSNFISPRIFLVSSLVVQNKRNEINKHIRKLKALESRTTPFEQAMIEWVISYANNNVADQIKHLKIALQYSPNNNMLLFNLARAYYIKGEYKYCIETIKRSVEQKWQYSPAYYLLGAAYERNNQMKKSEDILLKSLSIKPVFHEIYALLARIYLMDGDSARARIYEKKYIEDIKEMNLSLANAYFYLGKQCYLLNYLHAAVKYFRTAVSMEQNNPVFHLHLATVYNELVKTDSAITEYEQSLRLDSTRIDIDYILGKIYERQDDFEKAKLFYSRYLKKDSTSTLAREIKESGVFKSN